MKENKDNKKQEPLQIMWYETIQSTLKFCFKFALFVTLVVYGIANYGLIGFFISALMLTNVRISYPSVTYRKDLS